MLFAAARRSIWVYPHKLLHCVGFKSKIFLLLLKLFSIISAPVAHDLEWKRVLSNGMRIYYPSILLQALAFVIMTFGRH